jgi:murein DD-endopeptidase MepM/ murein hydrolase activator NlpD
MPWGCSRRRYLRRPWQPEPGPTAPVAAVLAAAALTTVSFTTAARARSPWSMGVFPVRQFVAYTSHYGSRVRPGGGVEPHHGLDIAAPLGATIHSWWGGVVQGLINDRTCGVGLVIRSGAYEHIYCHLAGGIEGGRYRSMPVLLRPGMPVRTGQLIGHVGLSGRSSGPHLHWGLRHRGQWLDPARILRAMAAGQQRLGAGGNVSKAPLAPRVATSR